MFYDCVAPDEQPVPDAELLAKFHVGNDRERDTIANLIRAGRDNDPPYNVVAQQERFDLRDRKGRVAISGKIDGRIEIAGKQPPFEIKHWSPYLVEPIDRFDDLMRSPYTRGGAYQLLLYLLGLNEEYGLLILDRSGLPKVIDVELSPNLDHAEEFLSRAEHVIDAIEADTAPPYIDDPDECHRCGYYGGVCNPPELAIAPEIFTDPALEAALTRRDALKAAGDEYADLDAEIKKRLRGVTRAYCGPFEIVGTWGKSSRVELPDEIKKQYTRTVERGRFTLTITKH
jgi:hypothetical protein